MHVLHQNEVDSIMIGKSDILATVLALVATVFTLAVLSTLLDLGLNSGGCRAVLRPCRAAGAAASPSGARSC